MDLARGIDKNMRSAQNGRAEGELGHLDRFSHAPGAHEFELALQGLCRHCCGAPGLSYGSWPGMAGSRWSGMAVSKILGLSLRPGTSLGRWDGTWQWFHGLGGP